MSASQAFDKIIENVKLFNLNFCLQLSPFSANINIKTRLRSKVFSLEKTSVLIFVYTRSGLKVGGLKMGITPPPFLNSKG